MEKLTKRKAFNFYRSYFDVFNELNDTDKLTFIKSLLNKQFLDVDPTNLKGMAKFAWVSQQNNIEQQLKGYKSKTKDPMQGGRQGGSVTPTQGGFDTPTLQEEEKGKEKGKEEYNASPTEKGIDFIKLLLLINETTGKNFKVINNSLKSKFKARLKDGYTKEDIKNCIINSIKDQFHKDNNFKYLKPEYYSRANTLDQYAFKKIKTVGKHLENPYKSQLKN